MKKGLLGVLCLSLLVVAPSCIKKKEKKEVKKVAPKKAGVKKVTPIKKVAPVKKAY